MKKFISKIWEFLKNLFKKKKKYPVYPTGTTYSMSSYYSGSESYYTPFKNYKHRKLLK